MIRVLIICLILLNVSTAQGIVELNSKSEVYKKCVELKYKFTFYSDLKTRISALRKKNRKILKTLSSNKKKMRGKLQRNFTKLTIEKYSINEKILKLNVKLVKSGCPEKLLRKL